MIKKYNLDDNDFRVKRDALLTKLKLLLANYFNIGDQLYPQMNKWKRGPTVINLIHPPPEETTKPITEHLSIKGDAIIFGGYGDAHQVPHTDWDLDENVTDKNALKDLFKPSSMIIPLSNDGREVYTCNERYNLKKITIEKGHFLIMEGDKVHGGWSNEIPGWSNKSKRKPPSEDLKMHPAFHCYIDSTHHTGDITKITVDFDHLLRMKGFEPHINTAKKIDDEKKHLTAAFEEMCKEVKEAADKIKGKKKDDYYDNEIVPIILGIGNTTRKKSKGSK